MTGWQRRGVALFGIPVVAAAATAVVCLVSGPVAVPAGLLLALVLPGLALVRLLFGREPRPGVERFALVVGLSVATVVLGGVAMYAVGIRLTRVSWAGLACAVSVLASVGAGWRERVWRRPEPAGVTMVPDQPVAPDQPAARTALMGRVLADTTERLPLPRVVSKLAPLALAALLLAGAGYVATQAAARHSGGPFTALSITPVGPAPQISDLQDRASRPVTVRVACAERSATAYLVRVTGPDGFTTTVTARLDPGRSTSWTLTVPYPGKILVTLYRDGDMSQPYRSVHLADAP